VRRFACSAGSCEGWLAVAPLGRRPLSRRGLAVETGTVARTYPFSAGTLQLERGVPFGVAASAPVTFSTAHPRNKNHHMCWYGTSGAGKEYSLRVLLSRERFANRIRIYGIDQDEQQEYADRFCSICWRQIDSDSLCRRCGELRFLVGRDSAWSWPLELRRHHLGPVSRDRRTCRSTRCVGAAAAKSTPRASSHPRADLESSDPWRCDSILDASYGSNDDALAGRAGLYGAT